MRLNLILIVFFASASSLLFSQFKKIPFDTSFYWRQSSISMPNQTVSCGTFQYQIKYNKDTLIQGKTFGKFSQYGGTSGTSPCGLSYISTGYLRQDTVLKKVSILDNNYIERPLYNFSKVVGDTMQVYQKNINANITVTVTVVDSLLFNDGKYHTRQGVFANGKYSDNFYQELGALNGGLFAQNNQINGTEFQVFYCYGKTSPIFTVSYNASLNQCNLIPVSLIERSRQAYHKLFPNPNNGIFKIITTDNLIKNIEVFNIVGQVVFAEENINVDNLELNLKDLPIGLYHFKLHLLTGSEYATFIKN